MERQAEREDRDPNAGGFAAMDQDTRRNVASRGGKAAHDKGTAHEFTREEAREAGRKGGLRVSGDRSHMADIGRRGGARVSGNREHMADIGRRGGRSVSSNREHMAEIGRKGGAARGARKAEPKPESQRATNEAESS
jgi:general stress protein YciG